MSKKIDLALLRLTRALEKHAKAVGGTRTSTKKSERAAVKLHLAASEYANAVFERTGQPSPFGEVAVPTLDESTIESLKAERHELVKAATKSGSSK
jgi:hypothetical protein